MNFRVETEKNKEDLQLGDVLISKNNELCSVVAEFRSGVPIEFSIKGVFSDRCISNLSRKTLRELTLEAINYGYKIFSKDDYELVLRKIS